MLRQFIEANQRISDRLARRLPQNAEHPDEVFNAAVAKELQRGGRQLVVDIGGGRSCSFASLVPDRKKSRLVAVDVSAEELAHNHDVDETRVADVSQSLPFADREVDLLVSRTVLEHIDGVEAFVEHSSRVLGVDGAVVHVMPSRYAIFAVVGRLVPFPLAKAVLHFLRPDTIGIVEFPVFYDHCYASAMHSLHRQNGFTEVHVRPIYGYQAAYFNSFLPAYVLIALYEIVLKALKLQDLAAYVLVVARRPLRSGCN